jgi:hypothetical protein
MRKGGERRRENQVSVPLSREQRVLIERLAKQQDRSLAGAIRYLIGEATRHLATEQHKGAM